MKLEKRQVSKFLQQNLNVTNYQPDMQRDLISMDGLKPIVYPDKISDMLLAKIQKDYDWASAAIERKMKIKVPTNGDFILVAGEYFRVATRWDNKFQYTLDGSYHLFESGECSYSGGFEFKHGSTFAYDEFELYEELKEGQFWIFSNNRPAGSNGVYFNMNFKVWKHKTL